MADIPPEKIVVATMTPLDHLTDVEPQEASSSPAIQDPEKRPACFKSTLQEWMFIITATMSIGTSSFLYGICTVITAPIGRTLNMTSAQITWINAASAYVYLDISIIIQLGLSLFY